MNDDPALAEWIIEQVSDALIYADTDGRIVRWNGAACALFGHSAQEALDQSLDLIIPERLRDAHWNGFNAAIASGKTRLHGHPALTRAVHKNGAKLYVEMTFALVKNNEGVAIGSVAMARDVTEKVQKERAARAPGAS